MNPVEGYRLTDLIFRRKFPLCKHTLGAPEAANEASLDCNYRSK